MQTLSYQQILDKIQNYCAYQERSTQEVKQKLRDLQTEPEDVERILGYLREFNFINESRFVTQFVRGKFRFKRWGRIKLRLELRMKGAPTELIEQAFLDELGDEELYMQAIHELLHIKNRTIREKEPFKRNQKLAQAAISRGFESGLVWQAIKNFNPNSKHEDSGEPLDYDDEEADF